MLLRSRIWEGNASVGGRTSTHGKEWSGMGGAQIQVEVEQTSREAGRQTNLLSALSRTRGRRIVGAVGSQLLARRVAPCALNAL